MMIDSWNDDAAYWGLTSAEIARWLSRLSVYHAGRSQLHAEEALRFGDRVSRWLLISAVVQLIAMLLMIVAAMLR